MVSPHVAGPLRGLATRFSPPHFAAAPLVSWPSRSASVRVIGRPTRAECEPIAASCHKRRPPAWSLVGVRLIQVLGAGDEQAAAERRLDLLLQPLHLLRAEQRR